VQGEARPRSWSTMSEVRTHVIDRLRAVVHDDTLSSDEKVELILTDDEANDYERAVIAGLLRSLGHAS
jgi:hypothetical protein